MNRSDDNSTSWGEVTCCNEEQWFFIFTAVCYFAAGFLLWHSVVIKPFKLFTTFLHELCHALAAWCCCGKVTGIEVQLNEGGLTHWSIAQNRMWCARHWVLPAGYIGSCVWGCAILVCSADPLASEVVGICLVVACAVTAGYAVCGQNKDGGRATLLVLCLLFGAWIGVFVALSFADLWEHAQLGLEASLLLVGALNILYASYDIYDDTIRRSVDRSDAAQCAKMYACCSPRCVGLGFFLVSLLAIGGSLWLYLALSTQSGGAPISASELWDERSAALVPGPVVLGLALALKMLEVLLGRRRTKTGQGGAAGMQMPGFPVRA